MVFVNIFTIILILCFLSYIFYEDIKLERVTLDLRNEKNYNNTLNSLYDRVRGYKHDIGNILQSIGGYISSDNIDGLKTYYHQLEEEYQLVNNLSVLNPDVINNPALYSLLSAKYKKAEDLNIKINLDVFLDLSNLNTNIYKFTRIFGIILDNAIEASKDSKEKIINIEIKKDMHVNRNLFIVENSYLNKDVDIEKIYEKGFTSKKGNKSSHGIGLWEVRKLIGKRTDLDLFTTKNNNFFRQQLEIYNK